MNELEMRQPGWKIDGKLNQPGYPGFLATPCVRTVATAAKATPWCAATWTVICRQTAHASSAVGTAATMGQHLSTHCIREMEKTTRRWSLRGISSIDVLLIIAILGILTVIILPNVLRYLGYD